MSPAFNAMPDASADRAPQIVAASIAMIILTTVAVILRFVSRRISRVAIMWDDWLILVALFFGWILASVTIWSTRDNFGKHTVLGKTSLQTLESFLKDQYSFLIAYHVTISMVRNSLLAVYFRVFTRRVAARRFTWLIYGVLAVNVAWGIAQVFCIIFDCNPPQGFWSLTTSANCIDVTVSFATACSSNVFLDLCTLALPAIMVRSMQLSTTQKWAVICTFCLGGFATLAGILRLYVVMRLVVLMRTSTAIYNDPTWVQVDGALLTLGESGLGIIFACLPSMRPLLRLTTTHTSSLFQRSRTRLSGMRKSSGNSRRRCSRLGRMVSGHTPLAGTTAANTETGTQMTTTTEVSYLEPQARPPTRLDPEGKDAWSEHTWGASPTVVGDGSKYSVCSCHGSGKFEGRELSGAGRNELRIDPVISRYAKSSDLERSGDISMTRPLRSNGALQSGRSIATHGTFYIDSTVMDVSDEDDDDVALTWD